MTVSWLNSRRPIPRRALKRRKPTVHEAFAAYQEEAGDELALLAKIIRPRADYRSHASQRLFFNFLKWHELAYSDGSYKDKELKKSTFTCK